MILILLAGVILLQVALDKTAAGTPANIEQSGWSPERSLLNFLGGIRQFIAYELFNKTDDLSDTYYHILNAPELVPYFRIITWLDPHFTRAYYIGAGILSEQGKQDEAIAFTEEGLRNNPDSADLHYNLGALLFLVGRYDEAIPNLLQALTEEPDQSQPLLTVSTLELAYEKDGQPQQAIEACHIALDIINSLLSQPDLPQETIDNLHTGIQYFNQKIATLEQSL